jgi:hypothetical protein
MALEPGQSLKKLIEAAVDAAKGKGNLPPDLILLSQCRFWGLPLKTGGLQDQDYRTVTRMEYLASVYDTVKAWRNGKMSEGQARLMARLVKMGVVNIKKRKK